MHFHSNVGFSLLQTWSLSWRVILGCMSIGGRSMVWLHGRRRGIPVTGDSRGRASSRIRAPLLSQLLIKGDVVHGRPSALGCAADGVQAIRGSPTANRRLRDGDGSPCCVEGG